MIKTLSKQQEQYTIEKTEYFLQQAAMIYHCQFDPVTIKFDLTGRSAGMYVRKENQYMIRYNAYIFAKYFEENLSTTVPHEVAHYITDMMFKSVYPHGKEWRQIMYSFNTDPKRTCDYDLEGIQIKTQKRHGYHCKCMTHQLSSTRHNKIQRGKACYFCQQCHQELVLKKT